MPETTLFVTTPKNLPTVPAKILFLRDAVQQHHWCFSFAVDGNPEPTITWRYKGTELKKTPYAYTQPIRDQGDGSVMHGCLFLNKPTHINNGNYTMIVQNKLGKDEATATGMFMVNPFDPLDPEGIIPGEFHGTVLLLQNVFGFFLVLLRTIC